MKSAQGHMQTFNKNIKDRFSPVSSRKDLFGVPDGSEKFDDPLILNLEVGKSHFKTTS